MISHRIEDLPTYQPAGHDGVINRLLVGQESHGIQDVSIWHGRLDPGGHSDLHVHPTSRQIYIGVTGTMVVDDGTTEVELAPLTTAVFEAGETHRITNRSEDAAEVLVISVPGLR
jgi:mannose-6-phosphate isomerase-like protein (cupin superfamily)